MKFYRNTATLLCLYIICVCFKTTELGSCDGDCRTSRPTVFLSSLCTTSVLTPSVKGPSGLLERAWVEPVDCKVGGQRRGWEVPMVPQEPGSRGAEGGAIPHHPFELGTTWIFEKQFYLKYH